MNINGNTIDQFREEFNKVKKELEDKFDVTISLGTITYWEERFSAKLTVYNSQDPEFIAEQNFNADVWKYEDIGFMPGMYRQIFIGRDNERYAIMGFNTRATKYPLQIIQLRTGAHHKAGKGFVISILDEKYSENLIQ